MKILGIETSCDETAAAVVGGKDGGIKVLSNIVSSQIEIHKKYGGVVPEVAAREHVVNILPVINEALTSLTQPLPFISSRERGNKFKGFKKVPFSHDVRNGRKARIEGIDAIAVTVGPGLVTSLLVGVETAKTLAYVWKLPVIAVNHIEGHIYANFIRENSLASRDLAKPDKSQITKIKFPAIILTVSGGHTMLVLMKGHGKFKILGETRDDAAGEAFDKAAQLLGLGYPGGPVISAYADKFINKSKIENRKSKITLPRPMISSNDFDFSFSGLKTALLYEINKDKKWRLRIPEYAAEFQQAIVDVLTFKTIRAAEEYNVKTIMLSGGVAANQALRSQLEKKVKQEVTGAKFLMPELKYCTDNAAMVATAGYFRAKNKDFTPWQKLKVNSNLELK